MSRSVPKIAAAVVSACSLGMMGVFLWQANTVSRRLPQRERVHRAPSAVAPAAGHEAPADSHGGASAASAAKAPATASMALVSLDEIFVNVGDTKGPVRSLGLKLELELFGEKERQLLDKRQAGIKNAIIQTTREQSYQKLSSVQGKLFFKELLVARINEYLESAAVRDIHFSSFFLQ